MAQMFIDKDFFFEFGKLEQPVQDKVREVFGKFTTAPHTGLHLEKVNNSQNPRRRTIRIDQFWRGVVLAPRTGDAYMLPKVLPHDDAYQWAARHRATVNTAIGVVEIRNAVAIDEQPVIPPHRCSLMSPTPSWHASASEPRCPPSPIHSPPSNSSSQPAQCCRKHSTTSSTAATPS